MHAGSSLKLFFETSKLSSVCNDATRAGNMASEKHDRDRLHLEPLSYSSIRSSAGSLMVQEQTDQRRCTNAA